MQHDIALNGDEGSGFVELFEHVVGKVAERYDRLAQKLINDSIVPLGAGYWRAVAQAKESVDLLPP